MRSLKSLFAILWLLEALLAPPHAQARSKKAKPVPEAPQDAIEVVAHITPSTSGPITHFLATQHYSGYYLYAEHEGGKNITLIDITKASEPVVLADVAYPGGGEPAELFAVAGTAALVTEGHDAATFSISTQTIRIMDLSDPHHPKIAREFSGVTAMSRDDRRGLIFVATEEDGVWILRQSFALDPELEKAYAHHVLYDH